MARKGVTRAEVYQAANQIAAKLEIPSVLNIRAALGKGSSTTINKYLKQWKQQCFQQGVLLGEKEMVTNAALQEENQQLKQALGKQTSKNEELAAELIETEHNNVRLEAKNQELLAKLKLLTKRADELSQEAAKYKELYNALTAEREYILAKTLAEKNELIESLRIELRQVNLASVKRVTELGRAADDRIIAEKVKIIHLEDKLAEEKQQLAGLQQELGNNKKALITLKKQFATQQKIMKRLVSFEQLQEYEKKIQQAEFERNS